MEINNKIVRLILILTVVFVVVGYGILYFLRLDNPVVINQLKDLEISANENENEKIEWSMSYITNRNDNRIPTAIEFPEHPGILGIPVTSNYEFAFDFNDIDEEIFIGQYKIKNIRVRIMVAPDDVDWNGLSFSEIKLVFNDESYFIDEIGEIRIQYENERNNILNSNSSSTCSLNYGQNTYMVEEDITITDVDNHFVEKLAGIVSWSINNVDSDEIVGMHIKKGEKLIMDYDLNGNGNISDKYLNIDILPKIFFEDEDGNIYAQRFLNVNRKYEIDSFKDLYNYIRTKENK